MKSVTSACTAGPRRAPAGKRGPGPVAFFKKNGAGYLCVLPVVVGIAFFTLAPMMISLVGSFFDYDLRLTGDKMMTNFGLQNYIKPFTTGWSEFSKSLTVTGVYTLINIPMDLILSFALAMFLNRNVRGIGFFRVLYYSPVLIPPIVNGLLWKNLTDPTYSLINAIVRRLGVSGFDFPWFSQPSTSMLSFLIVGLFTTGGGMILWLAQLKEVPDSLYESARLDGAGFWRSTFSITVPLCTPMIFYNVVIGVITTLQTFANVVTITGGGGSDGSLLFYVIHIYTAFKQFKMGEACALSWYLFLLIGLLTLLLFKTSKWVYYGEES